MYSGTRGRTTLRSEPSSNRPASILKRKKKAVCPPLVIATFSGPDVPTVVAVDSGSKGGAKTRVADGAVVVDEHSIAGGAVVVDFPQTITPDRLDLGNGGRIAAAHHDEVTRSAAHGFAKVPHELDDAAAGSQLGAGLGEWEFHGRGSQMRLES